MVSSVTGRSPKSSKEGQVIEEVGPSKKGSGKTVGVEELEGGAIESDKSSHAGGSEMQFPIEGVQKGFPCVRLNCVDEGGAGDGAETVEGRIFQPLLKRLQGGPDGIGSRSFQ